MQNLKVLLAIGAGLATAVVVACSSSSSSNPETPNTDAGDDGAITAFGDDSAAMGCLPLGGTGCAKGSACCLDLSKGLAAIANGGACVAPGTCSAGIEVGCTAGSDCAGGQVCCADLGGAATAGTLGALEEGGLGALGLDASALSLDAGTAGNLNISFKTTCTSACTGSQIQACASATDASAAGPANPISQLIGDAGSGIDAGGHPGGLLGIIAIARYGEGVRPPPGRRRSFSGRLRHVRRKPPPTAERATRPAKHRPRSNVQRDA